MTSTSHTNRPAPVRLLTRGGPRISRAAAEHQTEARPVAVQLPDLTSQIEDLPIALTVIETAAVLRVGRNKVYDLIHEWHATSGAQGLRSVRLGRSLRIPRFAVLEFLGVVSARSNPNGTD